MPDSIDVEPPDMGDKVDPASMKPESAFGHLGDGLFFAPALEDDPVNRAQRPRAVRAVVTVDEHRIAGRIGHDLEKTDDFFLDQIPGLDIDLLEGKPEFTDQVTVGVVGAEVDDGLDPRLLEVFKPLDRRLSAAEHMIGQSVKLGYALHLDGLGPTGRPLDPGRPGFIVLEDRVRQLVEKKNERTRGRHAYRFILGNPVTLSSQIDPDSFIPPDPRLVSWRKNA